jgi:hypothetical protein
MLAVLGDQHQKWYFWCRLIKTSDTKSKRGIEIFGVTHVKSSGVEARDRNFHGGVNTHATVSSHFSSLSWCGVNISFYLSSSLLLSLWKTMMSW